MSFTLLPVKGNHLIDRNEILEEIVTSLSNPKLRMGFALYGRRRIGKTSIIWEACHVLREKKNSIPVYLNVWDLRDESIRGFSRELSLALLEAYRQCLPFKFKIKNLIKLPLSALREELEDSSIRGVLVDLLLRLLYPEDKERSLKDVFSFAEALASETKTRCLIFIDEFPSMMHLKEEGKEVGERVIRNIRSIQEKLEHVILNISGSIRKTMAMSCLSSGSAFYKQLVVKEVDVLRRADVTKLVKQNLSKKITSSAIDKIYEFSGGIPFYVQFIGRGLEMAKRDHLGDQEVRETIDKFFEQEGNIIFKEELNHLSPKEKNIVMVIAEGSNTPTGIAKAINEQAGAISQYLDYLDEKGLLYRVKRGVYDFWDPVFKAWLKRRL